MIFNGIEKDYLTVTRGRRRPSWAPIQRDLINVTGMAGSYLSGTLTRARPIDVPIFLLAENFSDLQKVKEDLAEWLIHDEPKELIFKDEPDRTYYAVVDGELFLDELFEWGQGIITFICPDPYKYGPEQTLDLSDISTIENKGTAEADPIFELTAIKKATFAMISKGADEDSEYNLIGHPVDVDEEVVDTRKLLLEERGQTLDTWTTPPTNVDGGVVAGSLSTDNDGITVPSYGADTPNWHGPALMKEVDPARDFEVEAMVQGRTTTVNQTFRIEFYLFDENMNTLGKMAILDNSLGINRKKAEGRIGGSVGVHKNFLISSRNYSYDQDYFYGMIRMRRVGKSINFYVTRINNNNRHVQSLSETYIDNANEYQGRLKYVQIHIGKYGDTERAYAPKIDHIKVTELAQVTVDQTPYILDVGDKVTFDHKNDDLLINGEPRNDLKNFGGSFFKLAKGENMLIVTPEDTFDSKVTFGDKYL